MNNCHPLLFLVCNFHYISHNCHLFLYLIHTFHYSPWFFFSFVLQPVLCPIKYVPLSRSLFIFFISFFFSSNEYLFHLLSENIFPVLAVTWPTFCQSLVSSVFCRMSLRDERSLEVHAAVPIS